MTTKLHFCALLCFGYKATSPAHYFILSTFYSLSVTFFSLYLVQADSLPPQRSQPFLPSIHILKRIDIYFYLFWKEHLHSIATVTLSFYQINSSVSRYGRGVFVVKLSGAYTNMGGCCCVFCHRSHILLCRAWSSRTWKGTQTAITYFEKL